MSELIGKRLLDLPPDYYQRILLEHYTDGPLACMRVPARDWHWLKVQNTERRNLLHAIESEVIDEDGRRCKLMGWYFGVQRLLFTALAHEKFVDFTEWPDVSREQAAKHFDNYCGWIERADADSPCRPPFVTACDTERLTVQRSRSCLELLVMHSVSLYDHKIVWTPARDTSWPDTRGRCVLEFESDPSRRERTSPKRRHKMSRSDFRHRLNLWLLVGIGQRHRSGIGGALAQEVLQMILRDGLNPQHIHETLLPCEEYRGVMFDCWIGPHNPVKWPLSVI